MRWNSIVIVDQRDKLVDLNEAVFVSIDLFYQIFDLFSCVKAMHFGHYYSKLFGRNGTRIVQIVAFERFANLFFAVLFIIAFAHNASELCENFKIKFRI
jgi:hypothetical protein